MKDTSGPAFPQDRGTILPGMSLRQYYIGQALMGLCANPTYTGDTARITEMTIEQADALLLELAKGEGK